MRELNELAMLYVPLYNSSKSVSEILKEVVTLAKDAFTDIEVCEKVILLSALVSNKFIPDEEFQEIWEEIYMLIDEIKILKYAKMDGVNEGLERGRQEGRQEEKVDLVQNALREKLPVESIASIFGLSIEEIRIIEQEKIEKK